MEKINKQKTVLDIQEYTSVRTITKTRCKGEEKKITAHEMKASTKIQEHFTRRLRKEQSIKYHLMKYWEK